jgi:hypothetical protein
MREMRVIVINPISKTIEERKIGEPYYDSIKAIIGSWLERVRIDARNYIWVDEEGLLKPAPVFFTHRAYSQPLAGIGVVTGETFDGDFASTKLSLEAVADAVSFPSVKFKGIAETEYTDNGVFVISRKAIFE